MEPNKFDQSIKKKMEARTIEPSAEAWHKLEAMMPLVEEPKRKVAWLYIAASFTGLLIVGTIFFQNFETNIIQKDIPLVLEQNKNTNIPAESDVVNQIKTPITSGNNKRSVSQIVAASGLHSSQVVVEKNRTPTPLALNQVNEEHNPSSSSGDKTATVASRNKYISGAELLAAVSNVKLETNASERGVDVSQHSYKINPNSLLSSAETELNQSFRETALNKLSKNFNSIKTVLVNRNYAE